MSFINSSKNNKVSSIRKRYFSQTLFLGLLIIIAVLYFFNDTVTTKQKVTDQLTSLHKKLTALDRVEYDQSDVFSDIELFLLDPTIGNHAERIQQKMVNSVEHTLKLKKLLTSESQELILAVDELNRQFIELESDISRLIELRLDVNQQFPALALSAETMTVPQKSVLSNLQILINEIEIGDLEPVNKQLYPKLLKAYAVWGNEISQARIYYTNRFASFSINTLETQAESLENLQYKFLEYIDEFEQIYANEESFEGQSIVASLKKDAIFWYSQFQLVRKISESDKWRGDSYLMKKSIIPKFDHISDTLHHIKNLLYEQDSIIKAQLIQTTRTLFSLVAVVISLFLLFIFTMLFSLERMILQPISLVSHALKSRAFNREAPQLGAGKSREIRDLIEAFQEMDQKINERQTELEYQALHDHLTGLPNRQLLNQRLDYQILTSERSNVSFSLFLMDLDKFKDVNDSLGHAIGDLLLIEIAKRLLNRVRRVDTIARLGGDEFAVLLPEAGRIDSELVAEKLTQAIQDHFVIDGHIINIGSSIGVVSYPEDGQDAKTLLQHADIAMYLAKKNRQDYSFFYTQSDIYSQNRLALINDLRQAINNDSLELYFQPQIDIANEQIFGAEALLRWQHPGLGFIQPDKIIELAEYSGIIHQLSLWVIDKALEQSGNWHLQGYPITISVNISVHDFANTMLSEQISDLLIKHQFPSTSLTLEITESGMMENLARSIEILNSLNAMGINLSIDDFGTGFSSLAYLKQLPVNELKIDKSFVLDMDTDENDLIIVQSIINLGHNLGLKVVAEGVEKQVHLDLIKRYDCDIAQGYLYGKPQTADQFLTFLLKK